MSAEQGYDEGFEAGYATGQTDSSECGVEWTGRDEYHPCRCGMPWVHVSNRHTCRCGATWLEHGRTAPGQARSAAKADHGVLRGNNLMTQHT